MGSESIDRKKSRMASARQVMAECFWGDYLLSAEDILAGLERDDPGFARFIFSKIIVGMSPRIFSTFSPFFVFKGRTRGPTGRPSWRRQPKSVPWIRKSCVSACKASPWPYWIRYRSAIRISWRR